MEDTPDLDLKCHVDGGHLCKRRFSPMGLYFVWLPWVSHHQPFPLFLEERRTWLRGQASEASREMVYLPSELESGVHANVLLSPANILGSRFQSQMSKVYRGFLRFLRGVVWAALEGRYDIGHMSQQAQQRKRELSGLELRTFGWKVWEGRSGEEGEGSGVSWFWNNRKPREWFWTHLFTVSHIRVSELLTSPFGEQHGFASSCVRISTINVISQGFTTFPIKCDPRH